MKLSKKIKLLLISSLFVGLCIVNNGDSVFAGKESQGKDEMNRISVGAKIGDIIDDEGRIHHSDELFVDVWRGKLRYRSGKLEELFKNRTPDPCKDLEELKQKLALKQIELAKKQSHAKRGQTLGIHQKIVRQSCRGDDVAGNKHVFWVNKAMLRFDDKSEWSWWHINKSNKWYGDDLVSGEENLPNGVAILFPWAWEYSFFYFGRFIPQRSADELKECILDAANWVAVRGLQNWHDGLVQNAEDRIVSLDDYIAYLSRAELVRVDK